jgi:hypothetical protein
MQNSGLYSFNTFVMSAYDQIFEASNLSRTGLPKEMISAVHQKEEHRAEEYPELGYVNMGGRPVTLEYKYFRPNHNIEVPEPITFTGRKVPPPAGVARTAHYTDFAQYLQDLPNGALSVLLAIPEDEIFLYLYFKKKWGGGPNEGGQQYAIIAWDKEKKEAVDLGFLGLTTEGVEKNLVRSVHKMKGGNTNAKVQEYINSLGNGAPSRNNPLKAYEFDVTKEARTSRETREGSASIFSPDLIRVFASKYADIVSKMPEEKRKALANNVTEGSRYEASPVPTEVQEFASALGVSPGVVYFFLLNSMKDFRQSIWKEGGGSYQKASGYDLEQENKIMTRLFGTSYAVRYSFPTGTEAKTAKLPFGDTRIPRGDRRARNVDPEKKQRVVPYAGEYASIPSLIKAHSLDGVLHRFMWFMMSGKINAPVRNVLALLGIDPNSPALEGLPDFETWTL